MENVRGHKRMEPFVIISPIVLQARVITIIVEEKSFQIMLIQLINKRRLITIQLQLQRRLLRQLSLQIKIILILTYLLIIQMEMVTKPNLTTQLQVLLQVQIQITILLQPFQLPLLIAMIYGPTLNITYKRMRNK